MPNKKIKKTPMISRKGKILYGFGDFGYSMVTNTTGAFLMFFGTAICGIPGTLMGVASALSTAWDAVTDPIIGYLSDHKKSTVLGRRHGYLLISMFGLAIINVLLWSVPSTLDVIGKWLWILCCLLVYDVFTTFFATPNSALAVELSNDYNERTSIQSMRSVFQLIGTIVPTVLMGVLQSQTGQYDAESYVKMAYIGSSAALICGLVGFLATYNSVPRLRAKADDEKTKFNLKKIFSNFFVVLKKPLYKNLILGYMISMMASSFLTAAGMHVLTYTFKLHSTQMYLLIAGLFLMTIFSQPLWIFIVRKKDKRTAVLSGIVTTLLGIAVLLVVFLMRAEIPQESVFVYLMPALFLAGAGMGALYALPNSMMGDAVQVENARTKVENTGTYAGFMTLANKMSGAVTSLVIGVLLDLIGFEEGSAIQTPAVESGLGWLIIIGISVALCVGFFFYAKYNLDKNEVPDPDAEDFEQVVIKKDISTGKKDENYDFIEWE